jgi:S1-C subfamily serine protease
MEGKAMKYLLKIVRMLGRYGLLVLAFILSGLIIICASAAGSASPSISNVVELVKSGSSFCSGFYIGGGRFLTAGHCLESQTTFEIRLENGETAAASRVIYSPPGSPSGMDFGVIWVDKPEFTQNLRIPSLACGKTLAVGTELQIESFPANLGRMTTWGRVAGLPSPWEFWKRPVYRLHASATQGSSGGMIVLDGTDVVVGILVGGLPRNQTLIVAVPIDEVCRVFDMR